MVNIDRLIGSEHQGIDREMLACFYTAALSEGGTVDEINLRAIRAVIARWSSQQPLRPIPVSEWLPGPKDCDAESCCWRWNTIGRLWTRQQYARKWYEFHTHWLPAHALPLPEFDHE